MTTFAIVEQAGTELQTTVRTGLTYGAANKTVANNYALEEIETGFVQIMREAPDGLTTEF
jgi:hypothetical protein